ncbi:MAG: oligosaccharide flippase family protein, partial [Muribaculaceae bacterium]|nr:oligosaccharide flippase family protein [Muribaculaceae bacterium]
MSVLKDRTAKTLKWNTVDRIASQVLYGLSGIVLANLLSKEDFGLVGVLAVFQAFAILFVDSGFGSALLQKKEPDDDDYSTVFWFNLGVSFAVYAVLYISAPLIAKFFGAPALLGMSRVMFLTFVLTGLGIVQTNRLMKRMD